MSNPTRDNYRGSGFDVLTYFRMNFSWYSCVCGGLITRNQLAGLDPGLYKALWRENKLDKAIPILAHCDYKSPRALERFDKDLILRAYARYDGNANAAHKDIRFAPNTIIHHWRAHGLPIRRPGRSRRVSKA